MKNKGKNNIGNKKLLNYKSSKRIGKFQQIISPMLKSLPKNVENGDILSEVDKKLLDDTSPQHI